MTARSRRPHFTPASPPRAPDPETVAVTIATATLRALVRELRDAGARYVDERAAMPLLTAETALLRALGLEPTP